MLYEKSLAIERRLKSLVRLVRSGRHSTPSMAAALNVSIPTVSRDIMALRQRGFQIRSVRLSQHWAYELLPETKPVSQA
jgi:biotin operon repressor